jgi:photosystem II stability/assembly factor-like uncharacterized protein
MRILVSFLAGLILELAVVEFHSRAFAFPKEPALQENFYGVTVLDDRAWIVGYHGTILHSKDRGWTWETQHSPTRSALFRVRFLTPQKGWITGSYGTLLYTADGGKNWRAQLSGTSEHLFGQTWVDERLGWTVGSRGTILRTRDAGRSWNDASLREDFTFSSVAFVNGTHGWVAGEFGVIFHTQNGGESWSKQKSPVEVSFASGESRNLFSLLFPNSDYGLAFGLDGVVLRTSGGSRWEIMRQRGKGDKPTDANHLFAAAFNGHFWAVGERGTLLRSDLNGKSWAQAKAETLPISLNDIAFGKDGYGLIVGNRGVILRTEDGGTNWKPVKIMPRS